MKLTMRTNIAGPLINAHAGDTLDIADPALATAILSAGFAEPVPSSPASVATVPPTGQKATVPTAAKATAKQG